MSLTFLSRSPLLSLVLASSLTFGCSSSTPDDPRGSTGTAGSSATGAGSGGQGGHGGSSAGSGGSSTGSAGSGGSSTGSAGSGGSGTGSGGSGTGSGGSGTGGAAGRGGAGGSGTGGAGGAAGRGGAGGSSTGGAGGAGGSGGMAGGGAGGAVDPKCWDGKVFDAEQVPATRADIKDLIDSFVPAERVAWAAKVFDRRYATGALIIREANNDTNCFDISLSSSDKTKVTAKEVLTGLRTAVHECGHMVDLNKKRFIVRPDLDYKCDLAIARKMPGRKVILNDEFQSLWPKDSFRKLYLEDLGTQAFDGLYTEASQYINTLATSYLYYDHAPFDPIARDGAHAFFWYVLRYLRVLRRDNPSQYQELAGNACWRQLVLAGWGRVNRYLQVSKGVKDLGGQDDALLERLYVEPKLLEEVEQLRILDGCR